MPLASPPTFEPQAHARRQRHARLAEVIDQIVMHQVRRAEHGEDVDEAEQLHLEGRVLHRPIHQLIGPEAGREDAGAIFAGGLQQFAADFDRPAVHVRRDVRHRRRRPMMRCGAFGSFVFCLPRASQAIRESLGKENSL